MKTVALFIDADNISAHHSHDIISTAKRYGTLTIKRVYTNWTKSIAHCLLWVFMSVVLTAMSFILG